MQEIDKNKSPPIPHRTFSEWIFYIIAIISWFIIGGLVAQIIIPSRPNNGGCSLTDNGWLVLGVPPFLLSMLFIYVQLKAARSQFAGDTINLSVLCTLILLFTLRCIASDTVIIAITVCAALFILKQSYPVVGSVVDPKRIKRLKIIRWILVILFFLLMTEFHRYLMF